MRLSKATNHHPGGSPPGALGTSPQPSVRTEADLRAIDDDVTAAVGHELGRLLAERTARASALDPVFGHDLAERVARFTLTGGKRVRSQFVWWALRACGGPPDRARAALRLGAALELIQTCALVHDDVMDGSPRRRGGPSLHRDVDAQYADSAPPPHGLRFGESAAVLAGDLALAWADDVVADTELPPDIAQQVRNLWSAMRLEMVAGQYLDLHGQTTSSRSRARAIRAACLKSALYSVERPLGLGAALAAADAATSASLCSAGRCAGIAFQLRDDLLDVFGAARRMGKPTGGDIRSGKPTYLVAVAEARAEAAGDRWALSVLRGSLGNPDLAEDDLAEVRQVLVATGARAAVETRIERLISDSMRHLEATGLRGEGRGRLAGLLRAVAGAPSLPGHAQAASDTGDASETQNAEDAEDVEDLLDTGGGAVPVLLSTGAREGAR